MALAIIGKYKMAVAVAVVAAMCIALIATADTTHGANLPACPSDWPVVENEQTVLETDYGGGSFEGFHTDSNGDEWYIIRSVDDNGYSLVRAYPASDQHDAGYVTDQPSKVCYLIVRGPEETEDRDPPTQIDFPNENEPDTSSTSGSGTSQTGTRGTDGTPGSGVGIGGKGGDGSGTGGGGGSENWHGSGDYPGCGNAAMASSGTPDAPTAPTLTGTLLSTSVGVGWTAPSANGNPILHYAIMYTPQGGDSSKVSAGGSSEVLTGLSPGTTYEIRVAACNSVGFGHWSDGTTITTASTSGGGGGGATVGTTTNSGCGIAGRGTEGTPAAPAQPTVEARSATQIFVEWIAPDNGGSPILDYAILYTPSGGTGTEVNGNGVSEIVTGLTAGTEYLIQVAACNAAGWGDWSPGTILQTLSDPSGNGGGSNGGGQTSITCGDAAPGSTGTPGAPAAPTLTMPSTTSIRVTWVAPSAGASAILHYAIHYTPDGGSGSWTTSTGLSSDLTGLTADTQYHVRVAACNATGYGDWSSTASTPANNNGGNSNGGGGNGNNGGNGGDNGNGGDTVVFSGCGGADRGSTGTPDRPAAPTLIVTQDNTRVGVEWVAPNDNDSAIIGYSIMYVPEGGTRTVISEGGLSAIIRGLAASTLYEIRVSGCNAVGFSNWSQGATIATYSTPGPTGGGIVGTVNNAWCGVANPGSTGTPGRPNPPTVTVNGANSLTVEWSEPSDDGGSEIKMYAVQWTQGGASEMEKVMTGMTYDITGLLANTSYTVQVAACNAVGMSLWSVAAVERTDPASSQSTEVDPQATETPGDGDGNGGNGDGGDNGDGSDDRGEYDIVVTGTCGTGTWQGHTHNNTQYYWGGTVDCLEEILINSIDPTPRGRMWTKSMMDDHRHPGFSDYDHSGSSCNSQHTTAHANHTPLSCSN